MWNKMAIYFKPCGRASSCQRICIPSALIYRLCKRSVHHSRAMGATISLYSIISSKFARQRTGGWQWVIHGKKLWNQRRVHFAYEELSSWLRCTPKMRQRRKGLLGEPTQSVISWCSTENWVGSSSWMVVLVGGERESYLEPMVPVTMVVCSTGKWPPLPVMKTKGSKLGLTGWSWMNFQPCLCLCCLNH